MLYHTLEPVFDARSTILILGSFPSPKSRETGFYYGHPQNRFWPLIAALCEDDLPIGNDAKKAFLLRHRIALWDVLAACEIRGADDGSISAPIPNEIGRILSAAPIRMICTTGKKATDLYQRYCFPQTGRPSVYLPSTSPANRGRYPMEALLHDWSVLLPYLNDQEAI